MEDTYTRPIRTGYQLPLLTSYNGASSTGNSLDKVYDGHRTGSKVEGWKELIAAGANASSAYERNAVTVSVGGPRSDVYTWAHTSFPWILATSTVDGYPVAIGFDSGFAHIIDNNARAEAESVALSKLYKKLESERSALNSYAVLAEFGDVIRQFGKPFNAIVQAFERHENRLIFERRRLVGSKTWRDEKFSKIAADTWLETSFGLIPLFTDAENLAIAFARFKSEAQGEEISLKLRDRMRTRHFTVVSTASNVEHAANNVGFLSLSTATEKQTVFRCQYVVGLKGDLRADFGSNERLLQLLGFEPRNLPLAVWEATPWSWLVDYGLNVQNILQAAATLTSRVQWIVKSNTDITTTNQRTILGDIASPFYTLVSGISKPTAPKVLPGQLSVGEVRSVRHTLKRTLPSTLGLPSLYFKSPVGDLKKTANLVALAISRSRDHKTWLS